MKAKGLARIITLLTVVVALSAFSFSQGIVTGSIAGTVVDQQQAAVVGAKVVATENATNRQFTAETNSSGFFRITQLPVGSYTVTVEAPRFAKVEAKNVTVAVAKETDLGTQTVRAAGEATTVVVEGVAPVIESNTAQISASFDAQKLSAIPNAGGMDVVALYVPGVIQQASAAFGNTNGASISANGQRGRSNNFQIDGQTNNDQSVTGPGLFLSNPDVIAEYQVLTSNYGAEYGRNSGAMVNYVTKSGSNTFHGSLFEYYIGNWSFSRRNQDKNPIQGFCAPGQTTGCTYPKVPRFVDNRYGGTIGGPIVPNRLWFFGSYLENKTRQGGSPSTSTVATPTPAGVTALVAAFPNSPGVRALAAFGPYAITAGNPVVSGAASNRNVSDGVTTVSVPFANITRFLTGAYDEREWLVRGDWEITSKDRFFTRFIRETSANVNATGNFQNGFVVDVPAESHGLGFDYTRAWTSRFVQQVRVSKTKNRFAFEGGVSNCTVANILACPPGIGFTSGTDLGFGMQNNLPQDRNVNNYQIQSNIQWARSKHTFKFGGEYAWQDSPSSFLPNINGTYTYTSFDNLVRNTASTLSLADGPVAFDFKQKDMSFYFQDDWRVLPNLTLNMGLRWEWNEQAVNLLHDLTVANQAQTPPFWSTTAPSNVVLFPEIPEDFNNFAPNFGFAWTPQVMPGLFGEGGKTVIRGGYRLAFDAPFYNIFLNSATAAPVVNLGTITAGTTLPSSDFSGNGVRAGNLALIPRGGNPGTRSQTRVAEDLHNPYTHQWNLGIQRQFGAKVGAEIRYIGNRTVGQYQTINANPLLTSVPASALPTGVTPCTTAGAPGLGRRDCNFSLVRTRINGASGNYNGLQTRLDVANWHGLVLGGSYTWSKTMDNTSEVFAAAGGANSVIAQNPFNTNAGEYGESATSFPHVANIYWGYEVPWFKSQQGFVGRVFGGWNINGGWRFQSGEPFNPIQLVANSACDTTWNNGFIGRDSCRPLLGNPSAPIESVGRYDLIAGVPRLVNNSTCVGASGGATCPVITVNDVRWIINNNNAVAAGHNPYSGVGRNFLRGQSRNNVDMSFRKDTKFTERVKLQLGIDVFNIFNRMYFGPPGTTVNNRNINGLSPTTGAASPSSFMNTAFNTSTRRSAQLMAKIVF